MLSKKITLALAESYWDFILIIISSLVNKHETLRHLLWSGIRELSNVKQRREKWGRRVEMVLYGFQVLWLTQKRLGILSEKLGRPRKGPSVFVGMEFSAGQILKVKLWNHSSFASEYHTWLLQNCLMHLPGKTDLCLKVLSFLLP